MIKCLQKLEKIRDLESLIIYNSCMYYSFWMKPSSKTGQDIFSLQAGQGNVKSSTSLYTVINHLWTEHRICGTLTYINHTWNAFIWSFFVFDNCKQLLDQIFVISNFEKPFITDIHRPPHSSFQFKPTVRYRPPICTFKIQPRRHFLTSPSRSSGPPDKSSENPSSHEPLFSEVDIFWPIAPPTIVCPAPRAVTHCVYAKAARPKKLSRIRRRKAEEVSGWRKSASGAIRDSRMEGDVRAKPAIFEFRQAWGGR